MSILYPFLIAIHVIISAALIVVVLLQSSKGEGLAGAFGGGGLTGAVFGGRGAATFLSKATTILAVAFMVSSISLTFVSLGVKTTSVGSGVIDDLKTGEQDMNLPPAAPETPATPPEGNQETQGGGIFDQAPKSDSK